MGLLRIVVWTGCAVALGVYLATGNIGGKTPLEQAAHLWKTHGESSVAAVKDRFGEAVDSAREIKDGKPREHHSDRERQAINRLIAQHGSPHP